MTLLFLRTNLNVLGREQAALVGERLANSGIKVSLLNMKFYFCGTPATVIAFHLLIVSLVWRTESFFQKFNAALFISTFSVH